MEIKDLRLLVDVAQLGSFAEVARQRNLDPSWVSRSVANLEIELGFRVFQRSTRSVAPTESGAIYIRRVESLIGELEEAKEDALAASAELGGTLRMTATIAFGQKILLPLLPKFRALFPRLALDLVLSDESLDLVANRIDLAVRLASEVSGDLVVTKLARTVYRVCASPTYLATHETPSAPAALSNGSVLRVDLPGFRSRWMFRDKADRVEEVAVGGDIQVSGALALHTLTLAGLGPALLANWLVDEDIRQGRLIDLFPNLEVTATSFETAMWLVYPSRSFLPRKVRTMVDFLKMEIASGENDIADTKGIEAPI